MKGVAVELGGIDGPSDFVDDRGDVLHVEGGDGELPGGDVDDLAVLEVDDVLGAAHQRGDVRGEDVFVFTYAEDQRRAFACGENFAGAILAEHGDAVGALDVAEGFADGVKKAALAGGRRGFLGVVVGDEIGQHLGIRFGVERVALGLEKFLNRRVVFNHAVVNEGDHAVAAQVRMGVGFGDAAVGGPTRVADAGGAAKAVLGRLLGESVDPPDPPHEFEPAILLDGDARGVIAAIFEALQAFEQDGGCLLTANVAYDSTHKFLPI
jgi:hypothetical protein